MALNVSSRNPTVLLTWQKTRGNCHIVISNMQYIAMYIGPLVSSKTQKINKPHQVNTIHKKDLRHSTYMHLKHWKALETILKTESNYLLAKASPPIHAAFSLFTNVMLI